MGSFGDGRGLNSLRSGPFGSQIMLLAPFFETYFLAPLANTTTNQNFYIVLTPSKIII